MEPEKGRESKRNSGEPNIPEALKLTKIKQFSQEVEVLHSRGNNPQTGEAQDLPSSGTPFPRAVCARVGLMEH